MPGSPPIFVVSGGTGASGELVVRTALAQFRDVEVPVIVVPDVRRTAQLAEVVEQAAALGGTIVYTLVATGLRKDLIQMAHEKNVTAIDLMGQLLNHLAAVLGQEPLGQPGLYRQLRQLYFERVEAIEFTVAHDDGRNIHELDRAEIILVGVSRVGKTPLSIYLSVRGWKVANVPLIPDIPLPPELLRVDPQRVVGLTIQPAQLVAHRRWRQRRMGMPAASTYTDPADLYAELEAAEQIIRRSGFHVVDVTDKPMEESAEEVIALVTRNGPS